MAMRPILKKLQLEIKSRLGDREYDEEYSELLCGAAYDETKQKELRKYWRKNCVKLRPFDIPVGTKWVSKSSSGNYHGETVVECKAIGLINEIGYELLLDRPASLSKYCKDNQIPLQFDDDKMSLSTLSTDLLEKIYSAIVR